VILIVKKSRRADEKTARPRLSQKVDKEVSPQASHSCGAVSPIKPPSREPLFSTIKITDR